MKLADLRKFAIRRQSRIRFSLPNGLECVLNEHGIAQVPALRAAPDFSLEQQLAEVREFLVEPVAPAKSKDRPRPRSVSREEMTALAAAGPADAAHDEHDE